MEKLIFAGICKETGKMLKGSLIQFGHGTHTIMHSEEGDKGISSPVDPETVHLVNGTIIMSVFSGDGA